MEEPEGGDAQPPLATMKLSEGNSLTISSLLPIHQPFSL